MKNLDTYFRYRSSREIQNDLEILREGTGLSFQKILELCVESGLPATKDKLAALMSKTPRKK